MNILALESSALAASAALCDGERLLAQQWIHAGLTHSQTLLPMAEGILKSCKLSVKDLDLIAVAAGPGSFTGLRIGVSTAKGLAWVHGTPTAPCSSLASMAWNAVGLSGEICAVMDARREQVYAARFFSDGKKITRLSSDEAISLDALMEALRAGSAPQWLVGDGARLCLAHCQNHGIEARLAPPNLLMQSAWGVARCGLEAAREGRTISGRELVPCYLRLSQAERERQEKGR